MTLAATGSVIQPDRVRIGRACGVECSGEYALRVNLTSDFAGPVPGDGNVKAVAAYVDVRILLIARQCISVGAVVYQDCPSPLRAICIVELGINVVVGAVGVFANPCNEEVACIIHGYAGGMLIPR